MARHTSNRPSDQSDGNFELSEIFIGRQQQLDLFEIYLNRWKKLIFDDQEDESLVSTAPSPNNKIQGLVVLLYGRGGFGKSTLLKHYRAMALQDGWNFIVSKPVDWEFAVEGKRSIFNPPSGQQVDASEYFKVLCGQLAIALDKNPKDFQEYQSAVKDVERARKEASGVLDSLKGDDRFAAARNMTVNGLMTAASMVTPPPVGNVLGNSKVQEASSEGVKLGGDLLAKIRQKLRDKLGNRLGDFLEPALRLGLALGKDLCDFAKNFPLLIFFDTYEEIDEGDHLLRIVMGAAGLRVGWVIAGRDNLWAGLEQRERSIAVEYGYKDIVFSDRGLSVNFNAGDVGAFTLSDITEYFTLLRKRVRCQPPLPQVTEADANRILDVTQGVPLAVKIAAGLYIETADLDTVTEDIEGKRTIVEGMVRRYLLHTRTDQVERSRLYGLALLRRADQPPAIAAALGLTPEQAKTSYASELSRLHRRYSFIFTEKAQPSLHQEVRHFLRLRLLEHRKEPEIVAINEQLKLAHETALKNLEEHMQYGSLKERLQDDEWVGIYLDLTEQQFWLDPVEGVRYILPFMTAAAIYRRDINKDAAETGNFFAAIIRQPYHDWWKWVAESLIYIHSRNPSPEELGGLKELAKLASQRCPNFPLSLPDYRKELEAALWWRLGEAHEDGDDTKASEWYEKALTRLEQEADLKEDTAKTYNNIASKLFDSKKYLESIVFWDRALKLKTDYAWLYYNRGVAYGNLKEYQQAIEDFTRAIQLDPNDATAYYNRGLSYLWLKNILQARNDFSHCYELDSTDINAVWMAEWVAMSKKRVGKETAARLETIALVDPQDYIACICRGVASGLQGKVKEGLEEVERAILLDTEGWDAYFWKGMLSAYYYRGRFHIEETRAAIEQSLTKGLPPILLTPLYWLESDLPDVFVNYAKPLLLRYEV